MRHDAEEQVLASLTLPGVAALSAPFTLKIGRHHAQPLVACCVLLTHVIVGRVHFVEPSDVPLRRLLFLFKKPHFLFLFLVPRA